MEFPNITLNDILTHSSIRTEDANSLPGKDRGADIVLSAQTIKDSDAGLDQLIKTMSAVSDTLDVLSGYEDQDMYLRVEDAARLPVVSVVEGDKKDNSKKLTLSSIKELIKKFFKWLVEQIKNVDKHISNLMVSAKVMFTGIEGSKKKILEDIDKKADTHKELNDENLIDIKRHMSVFSMHTDVINDSTFHRYQASFKDFKKVSDLVNKLSGKLSDVDSGLPADAELSDFLKKNMPYEEWWLDAAKDLPKFAKDLSDAAKEKILSVGASQNPNDIWFLDRFGLKYFPVFEVIPYSFKGDTVRIIIVNGSASPEGAIDKRMNDVRFDTLKVNKHALTSKEMIKVEHVSLNSIKQAVKALDKVNFKDINSNLHKSIKDMKKDKAETSLEKLLDNSKDLDRNQRGEVVGRIRLMVKNRNAIITMVKHMVSDNISLAAGFLKASSVYVDTYDNK